jgi:hypothetical protein
VPALSWISRSLKRAVLPPRRWHGLTAALSSCGAILLVAALASAQGGSIPDLRGTFDAWACVGGTLAQCEANPTFPQTFTITSEDFSTGAISGTGSAASGDAWTVSGTISGDTVTLNSANFKLESYSSTAVMTISADADTLTGTFSDSYGRVNQPTFAKRVSQPTTPVPAPVLGRTVNVEPVSGKVLVKLPSGVQSSIDLPLESAVESLQKGLGFIPLAQARQIPVGSILDTTAGVARITTATSTKGRSQSGDFGAGIFKLLQNRRQRGLTDLNIIDTSSARQACATLGKARTAAHHLSSKVLGQLNASGHGHFAARGQYSSATVRGTVWSVTNQCDGTLTRVKRGVVSVRDFHRRKTITLFTGQSYLARAPGG